MVSQGIILPFDKISSGLLQKVFHSYQEQNIDDFMAKESIPVHISCIFHVSSFKIIKKNIFQRVELFFPGEIGFTLFQKCGHAFTLIGGGITSSELLIFND